MKYTRRTDDEPVAALQAQIEGIRERAARKAARADPIQQQARAALKAIGNALEAGAAEPLRGALETAAGAIRVALGTSPSPPAPERLKPRQRARAAQPT